jgi:hypothetical protein
MTPFLNIWDQIAGKLGIVTDRMHQSQLDMAASQEAQLRDANTAIASAMQDADPEQAAILAQTMRDRAQQASDNIAAINRAPARVLQSGVTPGGVTPLPTGAQTVAPFYQEREQGRIAANIDAMNKAYDLAKQRRDEFHNEITGEQKNIDHAQAEANTVLGLLNDLGADSDVVQSRFRDFTGMSLGDTKEGGELGSVGVHGIGHFDLGTLLGITPEKKASYDEIVKGVAAIQSAQTQAAKARITALQQHAVASGFSLDPETGGLLDVNIPQYQQGTTPVRAPNASDTLTGPPSVADRAHAAETKVRDAVKGPMGFWGTLNAGVGGSYTGPTVQDDPVLQQNLADLSPVQKANLLLMQLRQHRAQRAQRPVN